MLVCQVGIMAHGIFNKQSSIIWHKKKEVLGLNAPPNAFTKVVDISPYIIADKAY
jgi:hypothetical protein